MEEEDPAQPRLLLKLVFLFHIISHKNYPYFRVYPRRWIVLLVVALLNNSNTMSWIAFAPIANHVDKFYDFPVCFHLLSSNLYNIKSF